MLIEQKISGTRELTKQLKHVSTFYQRSNYNFFSIEINMRLCILSLKITRHKKGTPMTFF